MTPTAAETTAPGFAIGDRICHIGQRDAVAPRRPATGTVAGFSRCASDLGVTVLVTWDHEGNDVYLPVQIAHA